MFPENHRGGKQTPVRGRQRRRTRHLVTADDDDNNKSDNNNNNNNSPRRQPARRSNHQTQQDMMRFMDRPMTSTVGDWNNNNSAVSGSSTNTMTPEDFVDDELLELVHCIVRAADGRKADNIVALQVHHISTLASVLVILSGNSRPQNQAIAAAVTKAVAEQFDGQRPGGTRGVPEGSAESGWMLLDYGSVMVHVMTPKSRLFYNVEGQWKEKGGTYWDLSDILIPNTGAPSSSSLQLGDAFVAKEDDPFWS